MDTTTINGGTVRDDGAKVHLRDGTGPLTNSKHINPHIPAPARASICYGRNGVSPFPSLSIGQKCICLTHISLFPHERQLHEPAPTMLRGQWLDDLANHIPAGPVITVIELDELNQGLNVSSLSRISHA